LALDATPPQLARILELLEVLMPHAAKQNIRFCPALKCYSTLTGEHDYVKILVEDWSSHKDDSKNWIQLEPMSSMAAQWKSVAVFCEG
jgi:hypothetical protein